MRALRRIVLQREVERDAVRGEPAVARRIGAVVARVAPAQGAADEGRIELLEVGQRRDGLLAVDRDLAGLVDQVAAVRPHQPVGEAVAVADRVAERKAGRLVRLLERLAELEKFAVVVRDLVEARFLHGGAAIGDRAGAAAERNADPVVGLLALAVFVAEETPAAVALAEIFGDVGQFDQLVGIDVRVFGPAEHDVGSGAGIRRDRGLLADILPADEIDARLDAGRSLKFRRVGAEDRLVRLDETRRPQHAQGGAVLQRQLRCRGLATRNLRARAPAQRRGRRRCGRQTQGVAPRDDVGHPHPPRFCPAHCCALDWGEVYSAEVAGGSRVRR